MLFFKASLHKSHADCTNIKAHKSERTLSKTLAALAHFTKACTRASRRIHKALHNRYITEQHSFFHLCERRWKNLHKWKNKLVFGVKQHFMSRRMHAEKPFGSDPALLKIAFTFSLRFFGLPSVLSEIKLLKLGGRVLWRVEFQQRSVVFSWLYCRLV